MIQSGPVKPFVYSTPIVTALALTLAACNLGQLVCGDSIVCRCPDGSISSRDCRPGANFECRCGDASSGGAASTGGAVGTADSGGTAGTGGSGGTAGSGGTSAGGTGAVGAGGSGGTPGFPPIEDLSACTSSSLGVEVVDADYSPVLDVIAVLTTAPDSVAIIDPTTKLAQNVDLPLTGTSISVAPGGQSAAIGHNGYVSIVHLETATVETIPISAPAFDVVFGAGNYVFVLQAGNGWGEVHVVDTEAGTELPPVMAGVVNDNMMGRLHPAGADLYTIVTTSSPVDIHHFAIDGSEVGAPVESQYHGDYSMCGDLWISANGERILTACGTAFRAAPDQDEDLTYMGTLEDVHPGHAFEEARYRSLAEDPQGGRIFGLPQGHRYETSAAVEITLDVFDNDYLEFLESRTIPCMTGMTGEAAASWMLGRFVFMSASGESVYILSYAESTSFVRRWGLSVLAAD